MEIFKQMIDVREVDAEKIRVEEMAVAKDMLRMHDRVIADVQHMIESCVMTAPETSKLVSFYKHVLKGRRYWKTVAIVADKMKVFGDDVNYVKLITDVHIAMHDIKRQSNDQLARYREALKLEAEGLASEACVKWLSVFRIEG